MRDTNAHASISRVFRIRFHFPIALGYQSHFDVHVPQAPLKWVKKKRILVSGGNCTLRFRPFIRKTIILDRVYLAVKQESDVKCYELKKESERRTLLHVTWNVN